MGLKIFKVVFLILVVLICFIGGYYYSDIALSSKIENLESHLQQAKTEIVKFTDQIDNLKKQKEKYAVDIKELTNKIESSAQIRKKYEAEIDSLKQETNDLVQQITKLKNLMETMSRKYQLEIDRLKTNLLTE